MSESDSSTLTGFLFYTFFVYPTTSYILKPRQNVTRSRAITAAIAFLCLLAAVKTGLEIQDRGSNHYSILGVTRTSTPMEIKKAYKKLSLSLHPDKNSSPTAADDFAEVKASYDVLMDTEGRVVYNKFGDDGIKNNKSTFDEQGMLLEMGIFYATWGMLAFVLTLGKSSSLSRSWIYTGLIVMLLVEITLMTTEEPLPEWWFPKTTEHEWIWLIHALFPAFMNGCRCLGGFLYVDMEEQTRKLLFALREQNKDVLLVLRDVQIGVQAMSRGGGGGGQVSGTSDLSTGGGDRMQGGRGGGGGGGNVPILRATPTGALKELERKLNKGNGEIAQAVTALKQEGEKGNGMGFYLMILGYVAVSYFFNQE